MGWKKRLQFVPLKRLPEKRANAVPAGPTGFWYTEPNAHIIGRKIMKIIIAPAKKIVVDTDSFPVKSQPVYAAAAQTLRRELKQLSLAQVQKLWHCSPKLARENYRQLHSDFPQTPALFAFSGIQYQYMAPDVLTQPALDYLQAHLRILSGLYGILRPFDGIVPYRLEMQAKLAVADHRNLYQFWGDRLYQALAQPKEPIINLASQEYAKAITPYLATPGQLITVVFGHWQRQKVVTRATLAKMARGDMVRYLAENQIQTPTGLKKFASRGYRYNAKLSSASKLVFLNEA